MSDHQQAPEQDAGTALFVGTIVLVLISLLWVVLARAAGLSWKGVLHWSGAALLIAGILLAAEGISQVRREWTRRPGWRELVRRRVRASAGRAGAPLWAAWNWVVARWLSRLGVREHVPPAPVSMSGNLNLGLSMTTEARVGWPPAPAGMVKERLAWLEAHMADADRQLGDLQARIARESAYLRGALGEEKTVRAAEVQGIRDDLADFAGGGLRLQTAGVVCLLLGTLMTAIW